MYQTREANTEDILRIVDIYNQGIEDRVATLETRLRTNSEMLEWMLGRNEKYKVVVLEDEAGIVLGWASLNVFNSRCCYDGVADISIYIERQARGRGLGKILLTYLIQAAKEQNFHKLVLRTVD
jgi:L-amino acid N-acyltransferase YncA